MFESVDARTDAQTDALTPARVPSYKLTLWAFGSGELKSGDVDFFRRSRAANSIVSGGIWPKFKLIQAFMHVLITCKYEKDPIKNSRENVMT